MKRVLTLAAALFAPELQGEVGPLSPTLSPSEGGRENRPKLSGKPRFIGSAAAILMVVLAGMLSPAVEVKPLGARVIEPFDYHGVSLNVGPLLRQVLEVRDDYLRVPNDDYLKGFRQRAGKPAPGADLGGWYTPGTFHVFGQVLSGLARMYAATGDEACRQKLNALIKEWSLCIEIGRASCRERV